MKSKLFIFICSFLAVSFLVSAAVYTEPWNSNQDGGNYDLTNMNYIQATTFNGSFIGGAVLNDINWTQLQNYPVACPSGAVIAINDTVTCLDEWLDTNGDIMNGTLNLGLNNITNVSQIDALNWSNVTLKESQITNLQSYLVNNTLGWILNFSSIFSNDWTNVSITESQVTDLQNYNLNGTNVDYLDVNASTGSFLGNVDMANLTVAEVITLANGATIDNKENTVLHIDAAETNLTGQLNIHGGGGIQIPYDGVGYGLGSLNQAAIQTDPNMNLHIVADGATAKGNTTIGDGGTTDYLEVGPNGDIGFRGTAGFYPRELNQDPAPVSGTGATQIAVGEMLFWTNSSDGTHYLVTNSPNVGGVTKVQLT